MGSFAQEGVLGGAALRRCLFSYMKTFNSKQTEVILVYFPANKQLGGMLFCSDASAKKVLQVSWNRQRCGSRSAAMLED